jgi:hypothetical protein
MDVGRDPKMWANYLLDDRAPVRIAAQLILILRMMESGGQVWRALPT